MKAIEKKLAKLSEVGKELALYSSRVNGSGWHDLPVEHKVKCYLAESRNHLATHICGLQIGFFNPVQFQGKAHHFADIDRLIEIAEKSLKELLDKEKRASKKEVEDRKNERIEALKLELSEMEQND